MHRLTRRRLLVLGATATAAVAGGRLTAQRSDGEATGSGDEMLSSVAADAISRGLAFLAKAQKQNGSFGGEGYQGNVGVCALAAMAMLAAGSSPNRGPLGRTVARFVDYALASAQESGFINGVTVSHGPMYDHGFATLLLAETLGMTQRREHRQRLGKAVKIIIESQNGQGGWRYQPVRHEADVSVTTCQVMALRAARNAGLYVPKETVDRAADYIRLCQNADGGFSYMQDGGESAFPRSAAAVVALFNAAEGDIRASDEVTKALGYLTAYRPAAGTVVRYSHYYYGHYYAAQGMWHAGGGHWRSWYPAMRDDLLSKQETDGSWPDAFGREYATAMSCLALQLPKNSLPIFQR